MYGFENEAKELYAILKNIYCLHSPKLAENVATEVGLKSQNKNLELLCKNIISMLKEDENNKNITNLEIITTK